MFVSFKKLLDVYKYICDKFQTVNQNKKKGKVSKHKHFFLTFTNIF